MFDHVRFSPEVDTGCPAKGMIAVAPPFLFVNTRSKLRSYCALSATIGWMETQMEAASIARATALMAGNGLILLTLVNQLLEQEVQTRIQDGWSYSLGMLFAAFGIWRGYAALGHLAAGKTAEASRAESSAFFCFTVIILASAAVLMLGSVGAASGWLVPS